MTALAIRGRRGAQLPWGWLLLAALVAFIAVGFLVGFLPGDKWQPFLRPTTWRTFGFGLLSTLFIGGVSLVASLTISLPLALGRASLPNPWRWLVATWVEGVRATPVLVILAVVFFGLLRLDVDFATRQWYAIIGLTIYTSAVLAEILRAGIVSIPRGEVEASRSLGLSYWQSMRHVVLPQAYSRMTPAIVSQLITLIKDTSLAFIIAVPEVVGAGRSFFNFYGNPVETYIVLAMIFFAINFPLSLVSRRLEARQPAHERVRVGGEEDLVPTEPA
jgi:glutamate transport system permease protein